MVHETLEKDLDGIRSIIEATGLFPSEMLDPMIQPFFADGSDGSIWLTLEDPEPVGVLYAIPEKMTEGTWNILMIAIHSGCQRSGHGSALVSYIESILRERNARLVLVETSGFDEYEQARSFYRKIGFTEEARIREFYSAGEDKVVFVKTL